MLVRKGGKHGDLKEKVWFLFKERDEWADPAVDITQSESLSVTTGRDLNEIAAETSRVWGKGGEKKRKVVKVTKKSKSKVAKTTPVKQAKLLSTLKKIGKQTPIPAKTKVQLATLVKEAPSGDDWIHEIKFDGYRMLCTVKDETSTFISRNGNDWTEKFPALVETAQELGVKSAILDGEVVILQPDGTTSFQIVAKCFSRGHQSAIPFLRF